MKMVFKHKRYIMCCHVNIHGDPVLMHKDDINIIDLSNCNLISYSSFGKRFDIVYKEELLSIFPSMILSESDDLSFIYSSFLETFKEHVIYKDDEDGKSYLTGIEIFSSYKKEKECKWLFKTDKEGTKIYENQNKISDCR